MAPSRRRSKSKGKGKKKKGGDLYISSIKHYDEDGNEIERPPEEISRELAKKFKWDDPERTRDPRLWSKQEREYHTFFSPIAKLRRAKFFDADQGKTLLTKVQQLKAAEEAEERKRATERLYEHLFEPAYIRRYGPLGYVPDPIEPIKRQNILTDLFEGGDAAAQELDRDAKLLQFEKDMAQKRYDYAKARRNRSRSRSRSRSRGRVRSRSRTITIPAATAGAQATQVSFTPTTDPLNLLYPPEFDQAPFERFYTLGAN